MTKAFLLVVLFSLNAFASLPELADSVDSSPWLEIKSIDGKVATFIHQNEFTKAEAPKDVSFLSIYQMPKDEVTKPLMKKIKSVSKIDTDLTPANCYETNSEVPGVKQTWCENDKPFYFVVVEGGPIKMKENERTRHILASLVIPKKVAKQ